MNPSEKDNSKLTIAFVTSRHKPHFDWFFDSLRLQSKREIVTQIIVVDYFAQMCDGWTGGDFDHRRAEVFKAAGDFSDIVQWVPPKPNVWGGKYRLTKVPWWHKSAALNTALCLTANPFFAATDDRCLLLAPGWLDSVREAIAGNYAVAGSYFKYSGMRVVNGEIADRGTAIGADHRCDGHLPRARYCIPGWFFGCSMALLTEWALQVNGWNELLDGLGAEDTHFGHMLKNNGFDMRFDPRMKVIQDRTPGECGPEMKRSSKERFSHDADDKGHKAIELFFGEKQSSHPWKIREIRDSVLAGGEWPSVDKYPTRDWFDDSEIKDFQ